MLMSPRNKHSMLVSPNSTSQFKKKDNISNFKNSESDKNNGKDINKKQKEILLGIINQ